MTIAFDAFSQATTGTGTLSWTHTPVGTPRGVVVFVSSPVSDVDHVSGVTYGGVAMTEVADSPSMGAAATEQGSLYAYFLGASIPTGAQTVVVSVSGASNKIAHALSYTASADMELDDTAAFRSLAADTRIVLTTTVETAIIGQAMTGWSNPASLNYGTGFTGIHEGDWGSQIGSLQRGTANFAAGSPECWWFDGGDTENVNILAVAIRESSGPPALSPPPARFARQAAQRAATR